MKIEKEKIKFRRANLNDVEILVNFRTRFLNELYNHPENDEAECLRKKLREYFSKAIPSNDFVTWLAENNGKIAGTGSIVFWQIPPRYRGLESGKLAYILNLYTIPEARRKGICTQLLKELIEEAKLRGVTYLHLHASKNGINIYRKAGFVEPEQAELRLKLR